MKIGVSISMLLMLFFSELCFAIDTEAQYIKFWGIHQMARLHCPNNGKSWHNHKLENDFLQNAENLIVACDLFLTTITNSKNTRLNAKIYYFSIFIDDIDLDRPKSLLYQKIDAGPFTDIEECIANQTAASKVGFGTTLCTGAKFGGV